MEIKGSDLKILKQDHCGDYAFVKGTLLNYFYVDFDTSSQFASEMYLLLDVRTSHDLEYLIDFYNLSNQNAVGEGREPLHTAGDTQRNLYPNRRVLKHDLDCSAHRSWTI